MRPVFPLQRFPYKMRRHAEEKEQKEEEGNPLLLPPFCRPPPPPFTTHEKTKTEWKDITELIQMAAEKNQKGSLVLCWLR